MTTCNLWHPQKIVSGNSRIHFSDIWGQAYFLTFLLFKRKPRHEEWIFILRSQKHFLFVRGCRSPAAQLQHNDQLPMCLGCAAMPGTHKARLHQRPGSNKLSFSWIPSQNKNVKHTLQVEHLQRLPQQTTAPQRQGETSPLLQASSAACSLFRWPVFSCPTAMAWLLAAALVGQGQRTEPRAQGTLLSLFLKNQMLSFFRRQMLMCWDQHFLQKNTGFELLTAAISQGQVITSRQSQRSVWGGLTLEVSVSHEGSLTTGPPSFPRVNTSKTAAKGEILRHLPRRTSTTGDAIRRRGPQGRVCSWSVHCGKSVSAPWIYLGFFFLSSNF